MFATLRKATINFVMSVRPSELNNSVPLDGFSWYLLFKYFYENLSSKLKFYENLKASIHFLIVSRSVRLGPQKLWRSKHILCSTTFLRKSCCLLDNVGKYCRADRPEATVWRMQCACWTPKATNSHSEYVILITFPLEQSRTNAPQCYACLVLYDSFTEFCVNRSNGLVADTVTDGRRGEYCLDKRRSVLFVSYIQFVRRMLSCWGFSGPCYLRSRCSA